MRKASLPPKIMMRKEFQRLADMRASEAAVLAKRGKEQGAYYLAGFAIECGLKACIAKKTRRHQFPHGREYVNKVYNHDLEELLKAADLETELETEMKKKLEFAINWNVVKNWNVTSRYELGGLPGRDMLKAVTAGDGVLQWIKQYW